MDGPALIVEDFATTVTEPGWRAELTGLGDLLLTRVAARPAQHLAGTMVDPVMLEIFNNLFMSVAEQMGVRLRSTAHSVNIKERLDFSCAIFDAHGGLIANAPHIPVHLGSMGESIKIVVRRNAGRMRAGDVYVLNDPYHGGTHLPDITVVTPVFDDIGREILFYVASRGHHAEIGGITPGSMPAFSTRVEEEGVLIDNWLLVRGGVLREAQTLDLLRSAAYPSRNPEVNLADLRAQVAANEKGVQELRRMIAHFGLDVVRAYMGHVQDNAEEAVRRVITALTDGEYVYALDNGAVIQVAVRVDRAARTAEVDFTGTSAQLPGNFNAPSSVAMAAVLYVFRTLVADEIPLNSGCLKPVRVIIPPGCMLAPRYPAAVAAGNVETSQAITGALYAALGVMAEGSGTMNNVTIGNERYQYYETVASGSGAGQGFAGTERGADSYDQLPADRPRGAGMAVPGPAGAVRDPARQRRSGVLARRRRRPARTPLPGADDRHHAQQPPPRPALRDGGREAGRARTALGRACRWLGHPAARLRFRGRGLRRRVRYRDAGRRRIRVTGRVTAIDGEPMAVGAGRRAARRSAPGGTRGG